MLIGKMQHFRNTRYRKSHAESGLSLVELLIGMLVGLVVVGGVLTVYLTTIVSSGETLKRSKLNQEMNAMMSLMVNDIRRAGIWGNIDINSPQSNPFAQVSSAPNAKDGTALEIHDVDDNNLATTVNGTAANLPDIYIPNGIGSCIVYAYDADLDGVLNNSDLFGFRLNGNNVEMREFGDTTGTTNSCANGTWGQLNDGAVVRVTNLEFDMRPIDTDGDGVNDNGSNCIVSNEPNGFDEDGDGVIDNDVDGDGFPDDADGDGITDDYVEKDCYVTSPYTSLGGAYDDRYVTVEVRVVTITLEGELVSDPEVRATMTETVRVRNDLLRVFE